jgi:uncharacterized membrane protein
VPIIAVSGILVTFEDYAHNYPDPTAPGAYGLFFVGFWFVGIMVYFYSMAIWNRKNVQLHARYMLSTAVALIIPGFFRLYARLTQPEDFLAAFFEVMAAVSIVPIAMLISDKLKGRIYPPFVQLVVAWGIVLIAYKFIHLLPLWRSFAAWSLGQGF